MACLHHLARLLEWRACRPAFLRHRHSARPHLLRFRQGECLHATPGLRPAWAATAACMVMASVSQIVALVQIGWMSAELGKHWARLRAFFARAELEMVARVFQGRDACDFQRGSDGATVSKVHQLRSRLLQSEICLPQAAPYSSRWCSKSFSSPIRGLTALRTVVRHHA